jgi:hypothetical protein
MKHAATVQAVRDTVGNAAASVAIASMTVAPMAAVAMAMVVAAGAELGEAAAVIIALVVAFIIIPTEAAAPEQAAAVVVALIVIPLVVAQAAFRLEGVTVTGDGGAESHFVNLAPVANAIAGEANAAALANKRWIFLAALTAHLALVNWALIKALILAAIWLLLVPLKPLVPLEMLAVPVTLRVAIAAVAVVGDANHSLRRRSLCNAWHRRGKGNQPDGGKTHHSVAGISWHILFRYLLRSEEISHS